MTSPPFSSLWDPVRREGTVSCGPVSIVVSDLYLVSVHPLLLPFDIARLFQRAAEQWEAATGSVLLVSMPSVEDISAFMGWSSVAGPVCDPVPPDVVAWAP